MVDFDDLNPFARGFAIALFATYPEWRPLAALETWDQAEPGSLALAVSSPAKPERELWIGTWGEEITVGFGEYGWHAHFGAHIGLDHAESYRAALEEIDALLTDRLAIMTSFRDDRAGGSESLWEDEEPEVGEADRVEIESWTGRRDATLFPA